MATATSSISFSNASDAAFRLWVADILAKIDAFPGWTRSSDTGQVNTATCTRSNSAATNYAVWQSNDGGTTFYVRIDFANTSNSGYPGMGVTIGYATNGAGSITGTQALPRYGLNGFLDSNEATARTFLYSGANGRMCFCTAINATNVGATQFISVERSRDAAGAATNDGVIFVMAAGQQLLPVQPVGGQSARGICHYLPASGGIPNAEFQLPCIMTNNPSTAFGSVVALMPVIPLAGSAQNAGINQLIHHSADFTRDTQHGISVYGTSRNFYIIGPNIFQFAGAGDFYLNGPGRSNPNTRLAMLYE